MLLLCPIVKTTFKYLLQRLLGLEGYLYVFSVFKINTLRYDKKENQFFFFMDQLPEKGTVLDVGANIGIMSVPLAKRFPQTQVIAIEPIHLI
jgi:2-polyprenyl-3-methyl-5-hydroxy-6-metoxy-1,4-benzoquinol methylase